MRDHIADTLEVIDSCLAEVSHNRHLDILRDISALAIFRATNPKDKFSFDDAIETIEICEAWVDTVG